MNQQANPVSAAPAPHERVTAIVLAGGGAGDALARAVGAPAKALVPLKGKPLGRYVLDALRATPRVRRIVWVGAADRGMERALTGEHRIVPGGPRLLDSLTLGIGAALADAQPGERFLIVSADVPWLRAEHVDRFLQAVDGDADLAYPVVMRDVYEAQFAKLPRTWVRLREGEVTGGNLALGRPDALLRTLPWLDLAIRTRKAPVRLAWRLGPLVVASVALGQARLANLEQRVSRLLDLRAQVVVSSDPEVGTDVDDVAHLPATLDLPESDVNEVAPA